MERRCRPILAVWALALLGATSCYAHAEPAYVEVRAVPAHVETYPRTYYEGRPVYLIDGHWYFHDRGRWVYYRREPETLYRERTYIQEAPRAPSRRRYYEYNEPPRPAPPRRSAPPAHRVY